MPEGAPLHPVNRGHLDVLTHGVGIMQHAVGDHPDPGHGYCTDDVARALEVDLLHAREIGWDAVAASAARNVRFLEEAFNPERGRFRNFRSIDGTWLEDEGSEDCQGRAMLGLGATISTAPDSELARAAAALFLRALPMTQGLRALRAQSSLLLACDAALLGGPNPVIALAYALLADRLRSTFQARAGSAWPWAEARLTYENALPARALLVGGRHLDSRPMIDMGLHTLDWLISTQTAAAGHLSPIGNGWWSRGGQMSHFDQQPIEATALLLAAEAAWELTGDDKYRVAVERAYAWFLGENDLGLYVADPARGAGCDGLTPVGVNANQGAESTLMWLIAAEHVRAVRAPRPPVGRPVAAAMIGAE